MIKGFSFEEGGRSYTCTVEERKTEPLGTWWWFQVASDQQRYAPFQASSDDTQQSVKTRISAYYENLLRVRAEPAAPRHGFSRPGNPNAAKPTPGAPNAAKPAPGAPPKVAPPQKAFRKN